MGLSDRTRILTQECLGGDALHLAAYRLRGLDVTEGYRCCIPPDPLASWKLEQKGRESQQGRGPPSVTPSDTELGSELLA